MFERKVVTVETVVYSENMLVNLGIENSLLQFGKFILFTFTLRVLKLIIQLLSPGTGENSGSVTYYIHKYFPIPISRFLGRVLVTCSLVVRRKLIQFFYDSTCSVGLGQYYILATKRKIPKM